jgi:hypothetical protein
MKVSSKETLFLLQMSKNLPISFAAMMRLAKGSRLSALLTLKVEISLICLVGTVSMMKWLFTLPLKTLIRNKASRCRRLE